jgi:palmitoyltransferase
MKMLEIFPRQILILTVIGITFDILSVCLHIVLSVIDPGRIKNEGIEFLKLLESFDAQSLCPECEIIRTTRSRHCVICNSCIERYDHHCPWINNCVGIKNHNLFVLYLLLQIVSIIVTLAQSI